MPSQRDGHRFGGYDWVVVMSAFVIFGLSVGTFRLFGFLFVDIQSHYGVSSSAVSWIVSIKFAMFHFGGPLASMLILLFSQRVVIVVGGLLAGSGMMLAFLDLGLPWLYFNLGILHGLGISFSFFAANSVLNHYFVRWRRLACAIALSGEAVFSALFSPFTQWLDEMYGWQGSLLIIGALQLNICVCGILMRPLEPIQTPPLETGDGNAAVLPQKRPVVFQFSLLRKPELCFYILFGIFEMAGMICANLFLVPLTSSLVRDTYWPAFVLSVMTFADLAGRLSGGWIAHMRLLRNLQLLAMLVALLGVAVLLLPVNHNCWTLLLVASLCGFLIGSAIAIQISSIVDIVTLEGFNDGLGLFMLFKTTGSFSPPAAGWLVDKTNNLGSAFYFSGACIILSAVFVILADHFVQKRHSMKAQGYEVIGQED